MDFYMFCYFLLTSRRLSPRCHNAIAWNVRSRKHLFSCYVILRQEIKNIFIENVFVLLFTWVDICNFLLAFQILFLANGDCGCWVLHVGRFQPLRMYSFGFLVSGPLLLTHKFQSTSCFRITGHHCIYFANAQDLRTLVQLGVIQICLIGQVHQ